MSPFTDNHVKRPLSNTPPPSHAPMMHPLNYTDGPVHNAHVTRPLEDATDWLCDTPTVPVLRQTRPLNMQVTTPSTGLPATKTSLAPFSVQKPRVMIPAENKRTSISQKQRRGSRIFIGTVSGCILMLVLTTLLAVPLQSGQHAQNLVQSVNNWFTGGQTGIFTTSQIPVIPTVTPALRTNEGYCGGSDIWGTCATAIPASGIMGTGQMQRPIIGAVITQPFAHPEYQFWCGCWKPHTGIDLAAPYGTPIMAADTGQVIWTGWDWSGLGWAVKINHGNYIATIYGHMERFIVSVGQNVNKGQVIGYEGSTGASTGPHVHFMVLVNNIWVNPILYVQLP
ncbi:MAG: M23 family metallopeptidase [Ktedonobacteraceae bacterium]